MEVKEFKSFDEYENYVESDSYNELVPTIIIDENYCAIDFDTQISMVNVECGVWSSAVEVATGQHESRKYNKPTLRY